MVVFGNNLVLYEEDSDKHHRKGEINGREINYQMRVIMSKKLIPSQEVGEDSKKRYLHLTLKETDVQISVSTSHPSIPENAIAF